MGADDVFAEEGRPAASRPLAADASDSHSRHTGVDNGDNRSNHSSNNRSNNNNSSSSSSSMSNGKKQKWWHVHLCRGMVRDIRRRAPFYASDWRDAWDYRVVPATVYMYFANILPALAFSLDMFQSTGSSYGVNEVLLASVLGAVVFSLLAAQPLVIVGVTGPITVFNYTVYDIMKSSGVNYIAFMAWIGIWSLILHWILAMTNSCNWLRWVTRFPCDTFGFYVAFVYLQKGIQVLERLGDGAPFYLSITVALLVFMVAYICSLVGDSSLFRHPLRVFLKDYGTPLTLIFFTGFVHIGRMDGVELERLPTGIAFEPTVPGRRWLVEFWTLSAGEIFTALPFAILLTILFWFDHNVSSLIAQGSEFPLRKPAGFHWDLFLLGVTTGVAGILGLPFPNGLIPQAPFHTASLCVTSPNPVRQVASDAKAEEHQHQQQTNSHPQPSHVVEQRVSNLAQGLLTLGTMTGPLLIVLHLIPHGVLAGLFFIMGIQALESNGITAKMLFLLRDGSLTPSTTHPLNNKSALPRRRAIWLFFGVELLGFGATFAITQTVAAVGFPVVIIALIPVRALVLPRVLGRGELGVLDEPTASAFTMEGIGGGGSSTGEQSDSHRDEDGGEDGPEPATARGSPRSVKDEYALAEMGRAQSGNGSASRRRAPRS